MEYTRAQVLAVFQRRLSIELDVNTQVNIRLLDTASPPRMGYSNDCSITLEWVGGNYNWAVGVRDGNGGFSFKYQGNDYTAAVRVFEEELNRTGE